jgi:hypothetical protein
VNGFKEGTDECRSPDDPKDPNFRAEESALKTGAVDPNAPAANPNRRKPRYGMRGTIRIDVLEHRSNETVCVYDIKTGEAVLTTARIKEIVRSVFEHYPHAKRVIITQVRPPL